jgi:hypothetical protein
VWCEEVSVSASVLLTIFGGQLDLQMSIFPLTGFIEAAYLKERGCSYMLVTLQTIVNQGGKVG